MNDNGTLTPFAARLYGVAVIVAPLLMLGSTIAYVFAGDGINEGVLGGTVGVWSSFAMAVAFVGILRLLEPRAPRAAPILTLLSVTAFCAGVAFNVQAMYLAGFGVDFLTEAAEGSADGIGILAFLPWGWFAPLSMVLVGAFLWRTRTVSWWSGALLIVGGILFVTARPARIEAIAMVGDSALILAMVPIGWAMLTGARAVPPAEQPARAGAAVAR